MPSGTSSTATGHWDPLSSQFEKAWRAAVDPRARPSIRDYLRQVPAADRLPIFRNLMSVEMKLLSEAGESVDPVDYCALFPDLAAHILSLFEEKEDDASSIDSNDGRTPPIASFSQKPTLAGDQQRPRTSASDGCEIAIPGYEVLEVLGKGAMGIVYKARHLQLQRFVALKMILPGRELSERMLKRFLREAATIAQFHHPNIVQIHDIGEYEGQPYFSLELVQGGSLDQKLAGNPLPARDAAALMERLALAVDFAHQKGIVHRDLKPANILLTPDGIPKVTDFGLAKRVDNGNSETIDIGIMGTPSYMAPEQAWGQNEEVGPAADIYALGAIFYELLTGKPPFRTSDTWQTIALVRNEEPMPPRKLVPQLPRDLEILCLKCLNKLPAQRYRSAGELAEELRRYLDGRPILTRPASTWEHAWKWTRRRPAAAALILVSFTALLSFMLYLDQRARTARRELSEQQRIVGMREKVERLKSQSRESTDRGQIKDALGFLHAASEIVQAEPQLSDLEQPLSASHQELQQRNEDEQDRVKSETAYREFFDHRDQALFHGMVYSGVELTANVAATRSACRTALATFGITPESAAPAFSRHLSEQRRQECLAACYELLLVWAEAEVQSERLGEQPSALQCREALRLLDRAASLGIPGTSAYHSRRARYLELLGETENANRERQKAAAIEPSSALDHFLTGDSRQKDGRLADAARNFQQALRTQPDHFWARYFQAVCYLQLQRPDLTRENVTSCLTTRPDFLWLYLLRGIANSQLNEFAAARGDFQKALSLNPDAQARYGIHVNQGVLCIREAKALEIPSSLPLWGLSITNATLLQRGVSQALRNQSLDAGRTHLQEAIRLQPKQYPAFRYSALIAQEQNRLEDALSLANECIAVAESQPARVRSLLYSLRAHVHRDRGEPDNSLADLNRAVKEFPTAEVHAERGRILQARHRYAEALTAYDASLALRAGDFQVWRLKAETLLELHRDAEAVAALDHYLANRGPATIDVYRMRGIGHARLRQFTSALADFSEALALKPDSTAHAGRGWVLLANDAIPLALQDFEDAIRLDARNAEAYAGRGLIRARLGRHSLALTDCESALAHGQPQTPRLLWNVAHVYAQLASTVDVDVRAGRSRILVAPERCQEQALELIELAIGRVPESNRGAFWNQYIQSDTLLASIRSLPGYASLSRQYSSVK